MIVRSGRSFRPKLRAVLWAMVAAVLFVGCSSDSPPTEPTVLATWNGGSLDRATYDGWPAATQPPTAESIRNLALVLALADAAERRGLAERADVVLEIEAERHRVLVPALDRYLDAQVVIDEDEIDALVETYPDAFQRPRRLFLSGIFKRLPADEAGREALRREMESLRAQVVDGAELGPLAETHSESQSRFREGRLGFVDPAELPGPVRAGVENLQPGEVSALIEHAGGLAFYRCDRDQAARQPGPEDLRFSFRQNLFRQRRAEIQQALDEELQARIRIDMQADPVLQVGERTLPAGWLDALARVRIDGRTDPLNARQQRRLVEEWAKRTVLADHAESLGLELEPMAVRTLAWSRVHALATAELRDRVDARIGEPSEAALEALFEAWSPRLRNPATEHLRLIQFADSDGATEPGVVERARAVLAELRDGGVEFEAAARAHSVHPTAARGGDLGWLTRTQIGGIDVQLLRAVRALEPGQNSGLLRTAGGLWLVRLDGRRPAEPKSFEASRPELEAGWRAERIRELELEVKSEALDRMALQVRLDGIDAGRPPGR